MRPGRIFRGYSMVASMDAVSVFRGPHIRSGRFAFALLMLLAGLAQYLVPERAPAATFPNLFTVEVDLAESRERDATVRQGMAALLTRVTGRTRAGDYPELASLIEQAPRLVTSYGQVRSDRVRIGFNGAAVRSALAAANWPFWGAERPLVVVWGAIDFGNAQLTLLSPGAPLVDPAEMATGFGSTGSLPGNAAGPLPANPAQPGGAFPPRTPTAPDPGTASGEVAPGSGEDSTAPIQTGPAPLPPGLDSLREGLIEELTLVAERRGLPLAWPAMDELDTAVAGFGAIWNGPGLGLIEASERYAGDFALSARVSLTDLGLSIEWELTGRDGAGRRLYTSTVGEGIDWVADQFAAEFSSAGGLRMTAIDIEGVSSLADYGRVMRYLESLSIVESVDVTSFDGRALQLAASIRGDDSVLSSVFGLGGVLQPAGRPGGFGGASAFGGAHRYRLALPDRAPGLPGRSQSEGLAPQPTEDGGERTPIPVFPTEPPPGSARPAGPLQ